MTRHPLCLAAAAVLAMTATYIATVALTLASETPDHAIEEYDHDE